MAALNTLLYSFDPATGEETGKPFSPNMDREGNPLRPAFTTFDPAPEAGLREVALFLDDSGSVPLDGNGSWRIRPDWRGVPLWSTASGEPVSIQRPGQIPADISAIDVEPPAVDHYWDGSGWKLDADRRAQRLAECRSTVLSALNSQANGRLKSLSGDYPDCEVQSWSQQTAEADAIAENPSAPTPLLSAIASARGISVVDLAGRVRAKRDAYAAASGQIIGRRQALEAVLNAIDLTADDAEARIAAVKWEDS